MKNFLAIILCLCICFCFTSCKKNSNEVENTTSTKKSTTTTTKATTVAETTNEVTVTTTKNISNTSATTKVPTTTQSTTQSTTKATRDYYQEALWVRTEAIKYGESLGMTLNTSLDRTYYYFAEDGLICDNISGDFGTKERALEDVEYYLHKLYTKGCKQFNVFVEKDDRYYMNDDGYFDGYVVVPCGNP